MFIDASAVVAIINQEPGWQEIAKRLAEVQGRGLVSLLVRFEAVLAVARAAATKGGVEAKPRAAMFATARELVDAVFEEFDAKEIEISSDIGQLALDAAATYGKALGHPADLNFGDCFAYACARHHKVGLIYKGDDFGRTDLA
jgi:ribonuclease VapC